ncbi:MarR family transcriptional regulator [Streptomyces nigrescens]|uniref:MarR family transcriptional regulator n=1 Tax=Streptomyces nigrescens TaxID=1920 RepID=UPI0022546EA1|nr:helix-turn-helix domain-containing protein [Streptomyces libani]MCX5449854.1 helix-turn-helix domain-containing protein [Streptomyces libani]
MTIYSDDLVRVTNWIGGLSASAFGVYDAVTGSGTVWHGLTMAYCGVALAYTTGSFQHYLRRRDTRVVAHLAGTPGSSLHQICAATDLHKDRVGSSLQRLIADGLVLSESAATATSRSYRLTR